jgi:flavocytochrome c
MRVLQWLPAALVVAFAGTAASSQSNAVAAGGSCDLVAVVGGGLAGLSAAVEAYQAGAQVILLDKESRIGGNSAKATSGINGVTMVQVEKGIKDDVDLFRNDVLASGGGQSVPALVDEVTSLSGDAVHWLMEEFNLDLTAIAHCGGHSAARTHRIPPTADGRPVPVGWTTVNAVHKWILEHASDRVTILSGAKVTGLDLNGEGQVIGLRYVEQGEEGENEAKILRTGAVILTTGGFAYDRSPGSLLAEFGPDKLHLATTSGHQATGDGVKIGRDIGATLVGMEEIQVHPTSLVDPADPLNLTKFLGPETMRGEGGILVDGSGRRFVNELAKRVVVTEAIFAHGKSVGEQTDDIMPPVAVYLLMNDAVADAFGRGVLGFYAKKGLIVEYSSAIVAASALGMDLEILRGTMENYCAGAAKGVDEFGKTVFPVPAFDPEERLYVATVTPAIHYTMGGIAIDEMSRVLRGTEPIPGLFAAGEVSGGLHGVNRLAGNSLLECVVMGRTAGRVAAAHAALCEEEGAAAEEL